MWSVVALLWALGEPDNPQKHREKDQVAEESGAVVTAIPSMDAELQSVVEAWPSLSKAVRLMSH
jgi:hypothetical protein